MSSPKVMEKGKLKQASLMSFFSKGPKKTKSTIATTTEFESLTPTSSSPIKEKQFGFQKKEIESSPGRKNEITDQSIKTPKSLKKIQKPILQESSNIQTKVDGSEHIIPSSPFHSGRHSRKLNYSELSDDNDDDDDDDDDDDGIIGRSLKKKRKINRVFEDIDDNDDDDEFKLPESEDDDDDHVVEAPSSEEVFELTHDSMDVDNNTIDNVDGIALSELGRKKSTTKSKLQSVSGPAIFTNQGHRTSKLTEKFAVGMSVPLDSNNVSKTTKKSASLSPQKKFAKENGERYQWLIEIKDAEGRVENDPEYDNRSLYIPKVAWSKFTAFEKQYWEIKSKMWDTVVFFKKGKFYELYEKDADIAHQKFDLKLAGTGRANMRLAGIPEMSFDYWAKRFIDDGYKVARVDQKESLLAKEIREKKGSASGKEAKVIERGLSYILTCGTLTDESMLTDEMSKFCLAIKEVSNIDNTKTFGVCFVDVATGKIQITEFDDDPECSKLETLMAQIQPMEILVEKSNISSVAMKVLRFNSHPGAAFNFLKSGSEFLDHEIAFEELTRGKYFNAVDLDDLSQYPKILKDYYEKEKNVAFSAFGALLWYLRSLKLDENIISMGNFELYDPFKSNFSNSTMRLDGTALQNLEIFSNTFDQGDKGTLFKLLNRGVTAFGKRMFKSWVIHPLLSKDKIESRLDSVELLLNDGDLKDLIETKLSRIPDIERMLARIHSGTLKPKEFAKVVEGFETICSLVNILKETYNSNLGGFLGDALSKFPGELDDCINKWSVAFDRNLAASENTIVPELGMEPEFDHSNEKIKELENELEKIIRKYRRDFKCQEMVYKDSGKEVYLIEVPSKTVPKIPKDWQQMAATAKCKRYWSPEVKKTVRELMEARELHKILSQSLQQRMYTRFDEDYPVWSAAIKSVSEIDCLVSLARSSEALGSPLVRPEFIEKDRALLEFSELRHPCFTPGGISGRQDYIPNDVSLGVDNKDYIGLLTGANAAGKSTLLRMTCVAVIMAQIGCFVPATSARLTPIDAIMTRLGANDNIMQGKSTFFVELSETKKMLEIATPKSLIILDELGRGGSSSDGFAIAEAVLHHIATHVQSIGFFATHYATLGQSFTFHPKIKPLRMAIIVDEKSRNITFLYKLEKGKSNGSFGMHVASMCGVPREVIDNAEIAAKDWEHTSKLKKMHFNDESVIPLGLQSDFSWIVQDKNIGESCVVYNEDVKKNALDSIFKMIEGL